MHFPLQSDPHDHTRHACKMGGDKGGGRDLIDRQSRTTVETEPSEPEQGGTYHRHRQTVGHKIGPAKALSRPNNKNSGQGGHTAGGVDHQTAGEVHYTKATEPAAAAPDPVTDRVINKYRPKHRENHKRHEPDPLGKGSGDQRRRDYGKHALINHKHCLRNGRGVVRTWGRGDAVEPEPRQITDKAADSRPKRHRIAQIDPFDSYQRYHKQALHDRTEHILAPDHARVK